MWKKCSLAKITLVGLFALCSCSEKTLNEDVIKVTDDFSVVEEKVDKVRLRQKASDIILDYQNDYDITNNVNTSVLKITKGNETVYNVTYTVDLNRDKYKFYQSEKVVKFAQDLQKNIVDKNIDKGIEQLLLNAQKRFGRETINIHLKSLFFHKSILETKKRQLLNGGDCGCTVHPAYLVDKTGFVCQEDFFIPVEILEDALKSDENVFYDDNEKELFKEFIRPHTKSKKKAIRFDELYSFFVSKQKFQALVRTVKNNKPDTKGGCWFGSGSSHGCCGNYGGCCYYWHELCWVHDKLCSDCNPSLFCLPGCVPDNGSLQEDPENIEDELRRLRNERYEN